LEETVSQFIADQTQKLAEIERKRDRTEQELIKAQSKTDRTQLKSPIDGTVQQLSITTVGQVVTSGQFLLTVVPLEGPIEVEAMIANKDIGFVEPGQPAIVKIEAFPFTATVP
jgi:hemolysin D